MSQAQANPAQEAASERLSPAPATPRPWRPFREPRMPQNRHDPTCPTLCAYCEHLISRAQDARDETPLPSEDWK